MPINQAAKRLVRAFRIAFRAVRILATDRSLPWLLRILFVIGAVQIPFSPVDEIAAVIALAWLLIFHRPALARAMREARTSIDTPKERKSMSARKLVIVSASLAAVLAVVISLAAGAVPAFASTQVTAGHYPDRAYARTCHAFARWQAAGLPSERQTRRLARDAVRMPVALPDDVLRSDVSSLLLDMTARVSGLDAAVRVAHDCRQQAPGGAEQAVTARRLPQRSLAAAVVTGATVGIDGTTYAAEPVSRPGHERHGYPVPDRAVCVAQSPRPGHVPPASELGATGLTWQYVTKREAAYFRVSRCSVVVVAVNRYGQDADLILTPSGRVTGRS